MKQVFHRITAFLSSQRRWQKDKIKTEMSKDNENKQNKLLIIIIQTQRKKEQKKTI